MRCVELLGAVAGLLFWGLPVLAVYWIRRRKKIPGASVRLGRIVLVLWASIFPLQVVSLLVGFSRLEGNSTEDACVEVLAIIAVMAAAYVILIRTLAGGAGTHQTPR